MSIRTAGLVMTLMGIATFYGGFWMANLAISAAGFAWWTLPTVIIASLVIFSGAAIGLTGIDVLRTGKPPKI